MKVLELRIAERILLTACLPQRGGRVKMILVDDLARRLEFNKEEIDHFGLRDGEAGLVHWNPAMDYPIQFEVSDEQIAILKECIDEADRREMITRPLLPFVQTVESL